jgi:glycosyltransferase involved in cell wall biosynthesis
MLNLLQVGRGDVLGSRFNGFAIRDMLTERSINSHFLAYEPRSQDPAVERALAYPGSAFFTKAASDWERRHALHSVAQLHSFGLPLQRAFRKADVVHYQIIHDGFFSILAMPFLSRLKPSVWTWHDPWVMTGHCIYPMECERWKIGCDECPDLARPFAVSHDNTRKGFALKQWAVEHSPINIVLASKWMMKMAEESPIGKHAKLHHIPFGLDLNRYRPRDPGPAREKLGVRQGHVVIAVRGYDSPFKGVREFVSALEQINTPVCVLVMQDGGRFDGLIGKHQIISLDWSDDEDRLIEAYTASDFFVMPSTAEAFGLMAVEAMACGKPVIVFEGTSLPEVTFAPDVGIAVPMRDVRALRNAVVSLVENVDERLRRGRKAREIAERFYADTIFADRLSSLYRSVVARHPVPVDAEGIVTT